MKTSAMMTPVTPPGAIALRPQIRARSKYFVASASARRPKPGCENGRLPKPANCRANRRMVMGGMRPRFRRDHGNRGIDTASERACGTFQLAVPHYATSSDEGLKSGKNGPGRVMTERRAASPTGPLPDRSLTGVLRLSLMRSALRQGRQKVTRWPSGPYDPIIKSIAHPIRSNCIESWFQLLNLWHPFIEGERDMQKPIHWIQLPIA
jgi:hypothetical protein